MLSQQLHAVDTRSWWAASDRGPRRINADSSATHRDPATGRCAFAVADGVGDTEAAARAAKLAARTAVLVATRFGPVAGILAAQRALLAAAPDADGGDSVLVVAVPDGSACEVAWVGDARAYHTNGRILERITTDHTVAEYYAARGQAVTPRMAHLVTTSVRTVRPDRIGHSRTGMTTGRLLLCSDGVYRALSDWDIRRLLDAPADAETTAARLVADAVDGDGRDNATALVVDRLTMPPATAAA